MREAGIRESGVGSGRQGRQGGQESRGREEQTIANRQQSTVNYQMTNDK
ncbi:hypothetical protein [Chroococcidiopsis thermalis]|nr:hypothetical protein [Chroococcidiopsis thermalis]